MAIYISYVSNTEKGAEAIKDVGTRINRANDWIQKAGGKVLGAYATMGRYDYVWITEFSDSKKAWSVLSQVATMGATKTETVEALPIDQFLQVVSQA